MKNSTDARGRIRTARLSGWVIGASLRERRTWFVDEQTPATPATPAATPAGAQNTDDQQPKPVPYDRFKEVNDAKKALQDKLDAIERQQQEAAQADALKKGEFEKVIADLEPKAKRAGELEATLKTYLDKEIEGIPEAMRDLIPAGDVTAQLTWIIQAKAKNLFNRTPAPGTDAGETGDRKPPALKLTPLQEQMAQMAGMTAEQYAKRLIERGASPDLKKD